MNEYIPSSLNEIVLVGPLGPKIIPKLSSLPQIAVDGGEIFSHDPFLWIGDGDSLNHEPNTKNKIQLNRQKDFSDLAYTLDLLKDHKLKILHLWGFSGGRIDHELFNLGEVALFLKERSETQVHYYRKDIHPALTFYSAGSWNFSFTGTFSLGAVEAVELTIKGQVNYPIDFPHKVGPLSSFCLSNMAKGPFLVEAQEPFFMVKI